MFYYNTPVRFQSALPRGERPIPDFFANSINVFQSALPRGERRLRPRCFANRREFQSALPRGERQCKRIYDYLDNRFQSALPRGERRKVVKAVKTPVHISIRAPARGATELIAPNDHSIIISIRAPARGATFVKSTSVNPMLDFNPRSREGSDHNCPPLVDNTAGISIRAPARGATKLLDDVLDMSLFQSALPRGERLKLTSSLNQYPVFQSALPRGERRCSKTEDQYYFYFNPRSREGSD